MTTDISVNPFLVWLILLPLFGSFVNGLFGKKLPRSLVSFIACATIFSSAVLAFLLLSVVVTDGNKVSYELGQWISSGSIQISARFAVDQLSGIMICVITGVGFLIHLYSTVYMHDDPSIHRYFSYLNLFVAAMSILVLGDNLILMFVGWEGVGLCSYLLIGFWFDDIEKAKAGKKAFVVNRIGDFGFIMGALILFATLGTFEFDGLKSGILGLSPEMATAVATISGLFLFLGASGKSAQIPLYVWLPDAMAGPTPVSALIHAATMVTAGIYMICRLNFIYRLAPIALLVIAIVGVLTAFVAATIALFQTDIKKVLAYSTVSQLGFMFLGVGVSAFSAGFFHVFTHAFFKACLFLGSGAVIYAMHHEQDIRKMGGLWKKLPLTCLTFVVSTLAIMGFPGFSGFFSKDEIMWQAFASGYGPYAQTFLGFNYFLYLMAWLTAGMTSFYMWRVTFLTFFSGKYRGDTHVYEHAHESKIMSFVLITLGLCAVLVGYLNVPEILGGSLQLHHFLQPVLGHLPELNGEHHSLEWGLMAATLVIAGSGFLLSFVWFGKNVSSSQLQLLNSLPGSGWVKVLYHKWYVDEAYEKAVIQPIYKISDLGLFKFFDQFVIDKVGVGIISIPAKYGGYLIRFAQNGSVQRYTFVFVLGLILLVWMVL